MLEKKRILKASVFFFLSRLFRYMSLDRRKRATKNTSRVGEGPQFSSAFIIIIINIHLN